jgi:hypothetical protein
MHHPFPFRLAVLNPGGSDRDQGFSSGAGSPADAGHPPVNYHAYAACTGGGFYQSAAAIPAAGQPVLLLLRQRLKPAWKALRQLQANGHPVALSLKESGLHQVADFLRDAGRLALFRELCAAADLCLASTPELVPVYEGAGARRVVFIPTPYPVDVPAWNFQQTEPTPSGLFIGTREWEVPSRNHAAALLAARGIAESTGASVTVVNPDGRRGRRRLAALGFELVAWDEAVPRHGSQPILRVIEGRLPYPAYLKVIAAHRVVFQLDRSAVPGQVAGDALLCRVPCVGGDGAVERIAFPEFCGHGRDTAALTTLARLLLRDAAAWEQAVHASQALACERLSFQTGASLLSAAFQS